MLVAIGTQLGSYEITSLLGKGGMGEVYRARDAKLKREVAIKILPEEFSREADRLSRFQREAEIVASLNHPNIGAIYDIQENSTVRFLVLELVEGETLAQRIARGPVPVEDALNIGKQICEALEAAHEKGIVHRDLKPANVKIQPDGRVKVLDFGLAKACEAPSANANLSNSPTLSIAATVNGVILGTAAYMSPEQARGKEVDRRTDIFAFGAMLYEMMTGRAAFEGEDLPEILGAILKSEPDWTLLPAGVPPRIRELLRLCLEKNAKNRRSDATDVRLDIEQALKEPDSAPLPAPMTGKHAGLAWVIAGVATLAAIGVAIRPLPETPAMRVEINAPATRSPLSFALSPDGRSIVFVGSATGPQQGLWLRRLDKIEAQLLPGTEDAVSPFWSPDSRSIGFRAGGKLKRIDVDGGRPTPLADAGLGGSWSADGTILISGAFGGSGQIARITALGGQPVTVTELQPNERGHSSPRFLPDGKRFLFFVNGPREVQAVYLGFLDGSPAKRLTPSEAAGAFLQPDRIVFVQEGALIVRQLDLTRGELVGEPETLADSVAWDNFNGASGFSVSTDGRIAYRIGGRQRHQLTWLERSGKPAGIAGEPDTNSMNAPELSPDGRRVAIERTVQGNRDVWLMDVVRGGLNRFTFDPEIDGYPIWSPDGKQIAFESNRKGSFDIYIGASNSPGSEKPLHELPGQQWPLDWSKDGRFLLYHDLAPRDLWALPMTGTERKPIAIATTRFTERFGVFSPDGRWVAYATNESGRVEIVVQSFPIPTDKWPISTGGGDNPRWSTNGKELYFIAPDLKMMAAEVRTSGTSFEAATPTPLFQTRIAGETVAAGQKTQYAVSPDGRFLVNQSVEDSTSTPITLILNWKPKP